MAYDMTGNAGKPGPTFTARDALDHAWAWFALHAGQRIQLINFYLGATALLIVAYVTAFNSRAYRLAAAVAIIAFLASFAFLGLERRTQELVKAAESALGKMEEQISEQLDTYELRLVDRVENTHSRLGSYGRIINSMYWATLALSSAGTVYAIVR